MVDGAPGTAWASLVEVGGSRELRCLGTPAADDPTPLRPDHLFDLASLTKAYVATTALTLAEGGLDLDAPVAEHIDVGSGPGSAAITLRHLLTHTSGLPAVRLDWQHGLRGERLLEEVLASPLEAEPGRRHTYSCVGYVAVGRVLEIAAGRPLADLVADRVLGPLGATTATFAPAADLSVATEHQPHRGRVRGAVHDEMADALDRPVGNAGLFGTVADVAALGRMLLAHGDGAVGRVLGPGSAALMLTPVTRADGYEQAVGLRVRDPGFMAEVDAVGHTGFTGTSLVVAHEPAGMAVLLTNRVHDGRERTDLSPARRALARRLVGA